MTSELLNRYSMEQRRVINEYWETIRFTRRTCKVADGVREKELIYWSRFPVEIVVRALKIHIAKYPNLREQYTRGIIRNLAQEKEGGYAQGATRPRAGREPGESSGKRERNARAADAFRKYV